MQPVRSTKPKSISTSCLASGTVVASEEEFANYILPNATMAVVGDDVGIPPTHISKLQIRVSTPYDWIPVQTPPAEFTTKIASFYAATSYGWTFGGAEQKRQATKWRCPTGCCTPSHKWIKADRRNPLIPRGTKRWAYLYHRRGAVEREFGRLKHDYGLAPLRVRGLDRVRLHADLCVLSRLASTLSRVRAMAVAA